MHDTREIQSNENSVCCRHMTRMDFVVAFELMIFMIEAP